MSNANQFSFHVDNGRIFILDPEIGRVRKPETYEEKIAVGELAGRLMDAERKGHIQRKGEK